MKFICWNIKTNNAGNIQTALIAKAIEPLTRNGEHWMLAVLENKSDGEQVADALRTALGGTSCHTVSAGGGTHTKENVILITNCNVKKIETDTGWKDQFNSMHSTAHEQFVDASFSKAEASSRSRRDSTVTNSRTSYVNNALDLAPWSADKCRNPVVVTLNDGTRDYKLGFVHSPGPREKVPYTDEKNYAIAYFNCVMKSLEKQGLDGLMGDFNIYGSEPPRTDSSDLGDVSAALGGTTFKKATGSVGDSRLDRVYLTSQFALHSDLNLVNGGNAVSDHLGVSVEMKTCGQCWHALVAAVEEARDEQMREDASHLLDFVYSSADANSDSVAMSD